MAPLAKRRLLFQRKQKRKRLDALRINVNVRVLGAATEKNNVKAESEFPCSAFCIERTIWKVTRNE